MLAVGLGDGTGGGDGAADAGCARATVRRAACSIRLIAFGRHGERSRLLWWALAAATTPARCAPTSDVVGRQEPTYPLTRPGAPGIAVRRSQLVTTTAGMLGLQSGSSRPTRRFAWRELLRC
jgi:hypothetical protein